MSLVPHVLGLTLALTPRIEVEPEQPVVEPAARPTFEQVQATVEAEITIGPKEAERKLVTRADVEPVFKALAKLGWKVKDAKAITDRFLPDSDPLVRELRRSKSFATKIADYPNVYDRLDRLRRMPYGMRRVREFATTRNGHELLEYMTTTKGGANLQRQLSRGRNGEGFGEPTGKLYTRADLLTELRRAYDAENEPAPR